MQPDRRLIREGVLDARFLKNQEKAEGKSPVADGQPAAATPRKRTILGGGGGGHYRTPSNSSPTSPSTPQSPSHGQQSTEMRKRMFFLFNDSLLETKVRGRESERKSGDEEEYTFKGIYPINKVRVAEEDAGDDGCSFSLLIDEQSDRSTFTKMILTATSKSVALSWISDCKAAKDELREQWECTFFLLNLLTEALIFFLLQLSCKRRISMAQCLRLSVPVVPAYTRSGYTSLVVIVRANLVHPRFTFSILVGTHSLTANGR